MYRQGDWIDLCRGPHMRGTGDVGTAFKLHEGRGRLLARRPPQPGAEHASTARPGATQKELDAHLHQLEEAERRDHRRVGRDMDLFHMQEEADRQSMFWHPEGLDGCTARPRMYMRRRLNAMPATRR